MKPLPPSTYTPSGRVHAPPRAAMGPVAAAMYEQSLALFGGAGGPRMPLLHLPDVAEAWGKLNRAFMGALPKRVGELAILAVAGFWRSEMEWLMHAGEAADCGIDPGAIEAIRLGEAPAFADPGDAIVFRYADELQRTHRIGDETYAAARALLGDAGLVALTVAIGHFTNVAMTLRAHAVPIPDGLPHAFDARD